MHNDILYNTAVISGAAGVGGGVIIRGNTSETITFVDNQVMSNTAAITASLFGLGGGIHVYGGAIASYNSRIGHNTAANSGIGYGGGLAMGAYQQVQMVNTVLHDNQANTNGAAVALVGSASMLTMTHVTIARNQDSGGAAVWLATQDIETGIPVQDSLLMMTNTILVSHTVAISVGSGHTATLNGVLWFSTPVTVTAGVTATVSVANQLTGDPVFTADGYHITAGSAAIRAGVPSGVSLDIDGEGRPSANPSLGVDEYWPFKSYLPVVLKP